MSNTSPIFPNHANLFAVEEIVTFRNIYLVRASDAEQAVERVIDEDLTYFQQHISSVPFSVAEAVTDAHIVSILNSTEQPNMTLEEFTINRNEWLKNCVNE